MINNELTYGQMFTKSFLLILVFLRILLALALGLSGLLVIHRLTDFHGSISSIIDGILDIVNISNLEILVFPFVEFIQSFLNVLNFLSREFASKLIQLFLGGLVNIVSVILQINKFSSLGILFLELLGLFDHSFDLIFGQTSRALNSDFLFFSGALVSGTHVNNTIGIDIESNLNLRDTSWCRWNT